MRVEDLPPPLPPSSTKARRSTVPPLLPVTSRDDHLGACVRVHHSFPPWPLRGSTSVGQNEAVKGDVTARGLDTATLLV